MFSQENVDEAKKILVQLRELDLPLEEGEGTYNRDVKSAVSDIVEELMKMLQYAYVLPWFERFGVWGGGEELISSLLFIFPSNHSFVCNSIPIA